MARKYKVTAETSGELITGYYTVEDGCVTVEYDDEIETELLGGLPPQDVARRLFSEMVRASP